MKHQMLDKLKSIQNKLTSLQREACNLFLCEDCPFHLEAGRRCGITKMDMQADTIIENNENEEE